MSDVPPLGSGAPPAPDPFGRTVPDPPPAGGEDAEAQRWAPWSAPVALIAVLFGTTLVGAVVILVASVFGADTDDLPPAITIINTFIQDGAFVLAALLFAAHSGPVRPAQLGFSRVRIRTALRWMAIAYLAYWILAAVWGALIDIQGQDTLPEELGVDESTLALVAVCVLVTVVAPITEEIFFRGYFFGALRNWRGPWPAALITGVVFGAIHVFGQEAEFLVPLAILGVALCVVRWKTGSLLPCIALHATNNALAFSVAEDWTVAQGALLVVGATTVALLLCRPFLAPREQPA